MSPRNNRLASYERGAATMEAGPVGRAYRRTEEMVTTHPGSSALVTFGVGVGVGLVLTALLSPPRRRTGPWRTWYDSHVPHWASREHISDTVARVLPEALARRM